MNVGDNIRRIRIAKKLSQKEVIMNANIDTAQYSRIENNKTEPSLTTIEKITKALGVSLSELFEVPEKENTTADLGIRAITEKILQIEFLSEEEINAICIILDAFISKKKLKDTLEKFLQDIK